MSQTLAGRIIVESMHETELQHKSSIPREKIETQDEHYRWEQKSSFLTREKHKKSYSMRENR